MTTNIKIRKKSGRKKLKNTENLGKKELAETAWQRLSNTNNTVQDSTVAKLKKTRVSDDF